MLVVELRRQRNALASRQRHELSVGLRMIIDHALSKLFHCITRALLRCDATKFDFHHSAHCRIHKELALLSSHGSNASLFARRVVVARVAISSIRVLRSV